MFGKIMAHRGKKYNQAREQADKNVTYSLKDAVSKMKELAFAKFDESVDVHVNLSIDTSKAEQLVRGSVILPHGTGKKHKILVFAKGDYAAAAEKAGADYVGAEDLIEKIEGGWLDFDYAVATPDLMAMVGKVAKILGPRGLLPNKKVGTVTFDVAEVVSNLKRGQQFFKNDKAGIVHLSVGRLSLGEDKLVDNLSAFVKALSASKPPASKGKFIKNMTISSTMGPGLRVNPELS